MSAPQKDPSEGPKRPPDFSPSPSKRLKDRVSYYEKVWSGGAGASGASPSSLGHGLTSFDSRNQSSPAKVVQHTFTQGADGRSFQAIPPPRQYLEYYLKN